MAHKRTIASKATLPRVVEDFKRIHGIGPAIEKRLHDAGIRTFAQFASLSPDDIASLIPSLSAKQVKKQDWVSQARKLAPARARPGYKKEETIATSRQHYENFTFEFLLDEKNKIHRTRLVHVQSGDVDTSADWNTERLIKFIAWHTGACLSLTEQVAPATHKKEYSHLSPTQPSTVVEKTAAVFQTSSPVDNVPPISACPQPSPLPAPTRTTNQMRLLEWKTLLANTNQPVRTLPQDQAFDVGLTLDLTETSLSHESRLDFTTKLYARKMGGGCRELISETQSAVPYSKIIYLTIRNITLPKGLYRLEAFLTLLLTGTSHLESVFQSELIQVY